MSKNIIVLSDGTGQEGGRGNNTNIYKIFNLLEDRTTRQVVFYDRGLGTGFRKLTGNIGGMGISRNICECYEFIFRQFKSGDRIFLFGFSRGAATARSLSSFIHFFGILPDSRPELIARAYRIYKRGDFFVDGEGKKRLRGAKEFLALHHTMWAHVHFIGCFDTVAALGLPFKAASMLLDSIPGFRHRFHDLNLSESVVNAYQALAIDDRRRTFHPMLWNPEVRPYQTMRQVWFAGMHTDVGGGYATHELSDISLVWMVQMAVRHGLHIYPKNLPELTENADGFMEKARGKGFARLYRELERSWPAGRSDRPVVHASVRERTVNTQNENAPPYHPWILHLDPEVEPWLRYEDQEWAGA